MRPALPDSALGLFHEARQAHVVVPARSGPHVTPELFAWSEGRIWIAAAATTLKVKVLRRNPNAGLVVVAPGRTVTVSGPVQLFDALSPLSLAGSALALPAAARSILRYGVRNAPDLVAFAGDAVTGKLGWRIPPRRVLMAITPERGAYMENEAVVEAWGSWAAAAGDLAADVPAGGEPAIAGLTPSMGVPARWFAEEGRVWVPPSLLELSGVGPTFPLSVVTDEYGAPGPAAKAGTLLRGTGQVEDVEGGLLSFTAEREVEWDGVDTTARPAAS